VTSPWVGLDSKQAKKKAVAQQLLEICVAEIVNGKAKLSIRSVPLDSLKGK
jgi:hypothetical protein